MRDCAVCGNFSEGETCPICADERRDRAAICVVEEAANLPAIERTGLYQGLYHVLGGALSPLRGIGPEELRVGRLVERIREGGVREVILATSPNVEGEATAVFLAGIVKPLGVRVTRIAQGLPVGSEIEFTDDMTLAKALESRREFCSPRAGARIDRPPRRPHLTSGPSPPPAVVKAEIPMSQSVVEEAPAVDLDHIDRSLVGGIAWTGAAKWSVQLLSWATTLVLARLLTPDDFGLVALAQVYIGLVALINEMGIGSAVVTFRDLSRGSWPRSTRSRCFSACAGCAVSCVVARPARRSFFASPHLAPVIMAMSTSFVISSLQDRAGGDFCRGSSSFKTPCASSKAGQAACSRSRRRHSPCWGWGTGASCSASCPRACSRDGLRRVPALSRGSHAPHHRAGHGSRRSRSICS